MITERILRLPELIHIVGLSTSSIWRKELTGDFPKRIKLGPRAVGWLASEIEAWLQNRHKKTGDAK